jgi:hypothetical protein
MIKVFFTINFCVFRNWMSDQTDYKPNIIKLASCYVPFIAFFGKTF